MKAAKVDPTTIERVLAGEYNLWGPAADIMDEENTTSWQEIEALINENMKDVIEECEYKFDNKMYKDMTKMDFKAMLFRMFLEAGCDKVRLITPQERKRFLAKVMESSGLTPDVIKQVLAGETHLWGPAAVLMDE